MKPRPRRSRRSFFNRLLGFFVSPGVTRPYRQFAVAEPGENLPNRTLVERDTEAPLQFVTQIVPPPTHHPVCTAGSGPSLDKPGQFGLLPLHEF